MTARLGVFRAADHPFWVRSLDLDGGCIPWVADPLFAEMCFLTDDEIEADATP